MALSATTIAAGTTNTPIFVTALCKKLPKAAGGIKDRVEPALPVIIRAAAAIKNGVDSFSLMFKNPTTKPSTTSTSVAMPSHSLGMNQKRMAITTPIINAHSPNLLPILS